MKKTFKKITAAVMAVTTLAVGMTSIAANAAENLNWSNSTSGNVTTRSATTTKSIAGNPEETQLSNIRAVMSHSVSSANVNSWTITTYNRTSTAKHMYCHTYVRNSANLIIDWNTYSGNSGDVAGGSSISCSTSVAYANLPTAYTLCYDASISASTSSYAPVVQEIELYEMLTK